MTANTDKFDAGRARRRPRTHILGPVVGSVVLIGVLLGWNGILPLPQASIEWHMPGVKEQSQYTPVGVGDNGEEVLMVYIGSSTCRWSNMSELPSLVRELKVGLQTRVLAADYGFSTLGITSVTYHKSLRSRWFCGIVLP